MDFNNDKMIGNLPKNINKEVPIPNEDAKKITAVIKNSGETVGYQLSNGEKITKEEGIQMAKDGDIQGVVVASRNGKEYLRSLPDESEDNNLAYLPYIPLITQQ